MKYLIWALLIAAGVIIWQRGRRIRELAEAEADREDVETLVYDKEKRAYVPKGRKGRG
jgi:hypothetical protein